MIKKVLTVMLLLCAVCSTAFAASSRWDELLKQYKNDQSVKQLIFVQQTAQSQGSLLLYTKDKKEKNGWRCLLTCKATLGKNGLGKEREGDKKTPVGVYGCITAAGFADNPGTELPYLKMDKHIFCSREPHYYNRLQDDRKVPASEDADYMIAGGFVSFIYSIQLDYNKENTANLGSYIFLHCLPSDSERYTTAGCVAVQKADMRFILQHVEPGLLVCIYPL